MFNLPLGGIVFDAQIQAAVARKIAELSEMARGPSTGRLLEFESVPPEQQEDLLVKRFTEIANHVGVHYLIGTPPQALEQLVIAAENKGEHPAILIKAMLNSFLVSYITPQTYDRANAILQQLHQLREEVADIRKPKSEDQGHGL